MSKTKIKKKHFTKITHARLCVYSGLNNTIFSLTTLTGDVITQVSNGSCGFKNCKKSSPFALNTAINTIFGYMKERHHVKTLNIVAKGFNFTADVVSAAYKHDMTVESIEYVTCVPYGGTVKRRARRL